MEIYSKLRHLHKVPGYDFTHKYCVKKKKQVYKDNYLKSNGNPNEFLGQRKDLTPSKVFEITKNFKNEGATIIGGCCEIGPSHIREMSKLK